MLFNSYSFIFIFLPLVVTGYYMWGRLGCKAAAGWLAVASLFFYAYWDASFVPILLVSILFNYAVGNILSGCINKRRKKFWFLLGICGNITLLGYFKYTSFLLGSLNEFLHTDISVPDLILPIGISFFTFTQTAYLADLYRGVTKNTPFVYYFEFVTIFPHLIAGPIIVHRDMIPQFLNPVNLKINYQNMYLGLSVFLLGLAKKVIIADGLSEWSNFVFSNADHVGTFEAWIGSIAYTIQLYFDFSGYSDMAIGLGLMLNMKLPVNFNSPLQADNFIDFWRRWHMTLGQWVREYLYIPLGGNRKGEFRKYLNLFISMLVIGFWHGAGWTFILWGGMHGLLLLINHGWRNLGLCMPRFIAWPVTFLMWNFGLTIFRANNIHDAWQLLHAMLQLDAFVLHPGQLPLGWVKALSIVDMVPQWQSAELALCCIATLLVLMIALLVLPNPHRMLQKGWIKPDFAWFLLSALLGILSMACMVKTGEFLYFQF